MKFEGTITEWKVEGLPEKHSVDIDLATWREKDEPPYRWYIYDGNISVSGWALSQCEAEAKATSWYQRLLQES